MGPSRLLGNKIALGSYKYCSGAACWVVEEEVATGEICRGCRVLQRCAHARSSDHSLTPLLYAPASLRSLRPTQGIPHSRSAAAPQRAAIWLPALDTALNSAGGVVAKISSEQQWGSIRGARECCARIPSLPSDGDAPYGWRRPALAPPPPPELEPRWSTVMWLAPTLAATWRASERRGVGRGSCAAAAA